MDSQINHDINDIRRKGYVKKPAPEQKNDINQNFNKYNQIYIGAQLN